MDNMDKKRKLSEWQIKLIIVAVSIVTGYFCALLFSHYDKSINRTDELCYEYAQRNHEKEIAPTRYQWLGKDFVDNFDWYKSCVNHTLIPVAK